MATIPEVTHPVIGSGPQANFYRVDTDKGTFWFSYRTCIAFRLNGGETIVHQNNWGPTTGKHLNYVDGGDKASKARRLSADEFTDLLERA